MVALGLIVKGLLIIKLPCSIIKCKFICTFNTNIENVDKALLRKGRMKLKYEFVINNVAGETIAVSAVDINKHIADFNSTGSAAEIAAAGINIYSTYLNNGYATLSGTSMATPIISGAVAILQAKGRMRYGRKLTPDEIRLLLNIYTEDLSGSGKDDRYGYGLFSFGRINGSDYVEGKLEETLYQKKTEITRLCF